MSEVRPSVGRCPICDGIIWGQVDMNQPGAFLCSDAFDQYLHQKTEPVEFNVRLAALLNAMPVGPTHAELGYGEEDE